MHEQKLDKTEVRILTDSFDKLIAEDNKVFNDFLERNWMNHGTLNDEINWSKVSDFINKNI